MKANEKVLKYLDPSHDPALALGFLMGDPVTGKGRTREDGSDPLDRYRPWLDPRSGVIVVGVKDGRITEDGSGVQEFDCFADALEVFPMLDIKKGAEGFMHATNGGETADGRPRMRIETEIAERSYGF